MKSFFKSLLYRLFQKTGNRRSRVIYYHDVFEKSCHTEMGTPLDVFKTHIEEARAMGFSFVPEITESENQLQICFDDGFRGIWETRNFFFEEKIFPTIFLAIDLIDQKGYLKKNEIRELQARGFRFQSHTWSHKNLTKFTDSELKHEISDSKFELEKFLKKEVDELCFPQGFFSQRVIKIALSSGYKKLYTSLPGGRFDSTGIDPIEKLICRSFAQGINLQDFRATLHGGDRALFWIRKRKHYDKKDF